MVPVCALRSACASMPSNLTEAIKSVPSCTGTNNFEKLYCSTSLLILFELGLSSISTRQLAYRTGSGT